MAETGKRRISVSDFYKMSCPTKQAFSKLVGGDSRAKAFSEVTSLVCGDLVTGKYTEEKVSEYLAVSYKDEYFPFKKWQRETALADDFNKIMRFIRFASEGGTKFVAANLTASAEVGEVENIGDLELTCRVSLVFEGENGNYGAFIIKGGKADKSYGGKSVHTRADTDLYAMVAKSALEERYPGIAVSLVYLTNDTDTLGNVGEFAVLKTKKSNIFSMSYGEYYEGGLWQSEAFRQKMAEVASQRPKAECYGCYTKALCATDTIKTMNRAMGRSEEDHEKRSSEPVFTKAQSKVINKGAGPMLVCAGPGTGKTATLVGRAKRLISEGVPPEFILCITFTNKAAASLEERAADEKIGTPKCSTIHSLALEILQQNEGYVGNVQVLTSPKQVELIGNLVDNLEQPLKGFNYGSGEEGRVEFLLTLARRLNEYRADAEAFRKKHKELSEDFYYFAADYAGIVEALGYLTFDEVIVKATEFLRSHEEILKCYTAMWKFIMVDEFQDVDKAQTEFVYLLAGHRNLVVVGDDDQSIYGFRGGSNYFMLHFKDVFPEAETVVLDVNFRAKGALVDATKRLIEGSSKERIKKNIKSSRQKGVAPTVRIGVSAKDIEKCVLEAVKQGYRYDDISVLASKNATLEGISKGVSFPCILGKSMLIDHALFRVILNVLKMRDGNLTDELVVQFLLLMGITGEELIKLPGNEGILERLALSGYLTADGADMKKLEAKGDGISKALVEMFRLLNLAESGASAPYFISEVLRSYDMEGTSFSDALEKVVEESHIEELDRLFEVMQYMADFNDETRLEPDRKGSVLLITSHESKGLEFPVVIMVDDYSADGGTETSRLYYVAMTRAKDLLFIQKGSEQVTLFDAFAA